MASRKTKTPQANPKPQPFRQPTADTAGSGLSLPPAVNRRLAILNEDSDLEIVLSEAVQRLWNQCYPRQSSLELSTSTAGAPAKASPASEASAGAMMSDVAELKAIPPAAVARAAEPPVYRNMGSVAASVK